MHYPLCYGDTIELTLIYYELDRFGGRGIQLSYGRMNWEAHAKVVYAN